MKVFDNRNTKKDHKKSEHKHHLRQLDVYNKKIITKSNSHQIKPKQNRLIYASLEKIWDRFSIRLDWLTGRQKSEKKQRGAKLKNTFLFLKTINFKVIIVNRYHLKSVKFLKSP